MELTNLDVSESSSAESGDVDEARAAEEEQETSPERTGPPSEASSQEWDRVTDPGSQSLSL
jgi:mitochondrial import receptor subunit TOM20